MRFVIFTQSLVSDWNHGNAHFLRGLSTELVESGHSVRILEPEDGWSRRNLLAERGQSAIGEFGQVYPKISSRTYDRASLDLDAELRGADVAIVHEWNPPDLVAAIGRHRVESGQYRLFFHDSHHHSVTDPEAISQCDLRFYDGVLASGEAICREYLRRKWTRRAWVLHEAADTRVFRPMLHTPKDADLVWIGNWGDGERTEELKEFLIEPVRRLGIKAKVFGVRYPASAIQELADAGIEYGGWLPNYRVPAVFARHRVAIHIPRRPYVERLPGIPTIRPFEAMACAIPLVSAPWRDAEGLFHIGKDFLMANDSGEMRENLETVLGSPLRAASLTTSGLATIRDRHTCVHRAKQLVSLAQSALHVTEQVA